MYMVVVSRRLVTVPFRGRWPHARGDGETEVNVLEILHTLNFKWIIAICFDYYSLVGSVLWNVRNGS